MLIPTFNVAVSKCSRGSDGTLTRSTIKQTRLCFEIKADGRCGKLEELWMELNNVDVHGGFERLK